TALIAGRGGGATPCRGWASRGRRRVSARQRASASFSSSRARRASAISGSRAATASMRPRSPRSLSAAVRPDRARSKTSRSRSADSWSGAPRFSGTASGRSLLLMTPPLRETAGGGGEVGRGGLRRLVAQPAPQLLLVVPEQRLEVGVGHLDA